MKHLLTLEQAAEITQVPVVTLRRKCASGDLRATKPNGSWRIYEDALEEWLRRYEPRTEPGVIAPDTPARRLAQDRGFRALVGGKS